MLYITMANQTSQLCTYCIDEAMLHFISILAFDAFLEGYNRYRFYALCASVFLYCRVTEMSSTSIVFLNSALSLFSHRFRLIFNSLSSYFILMVLGRDKYLLLGFTMRRSYEILAVEFPASLWFEDVCAKHLSPASFFRYSEMFSNLT